MRGDKELQARAGVFLGSPRRSFSVMEMNDNLHYMAYLEI